MTTFTRAVVACAFVSALVSPVLLAAPAAGQEPTLTVLGSTNTLKVTGSEGKNSAAGYFSLLNSGKEPADVSVKFQATSSEKVTVESVTPTEVEPGGAQRIGVTFTGLNELEGPATGQLVIAGGPSPTAQSVEVIPAPQPSAPWPVILILGSLVVASMLGLMVVGNLPGDDRSRLRNAAPGAKWDSKSWATTLTSLGAILGTVLGGITFPTFPEQIAKVTLVNLNLFFGFLVIVGPFLFQALRRKNLSDAERKEGRFGTNLTLLIASTITLWAVLGQLGAFSLLSWELVGGGELGIAAAVVLALIGVLAARYFFLTMSEMVLKDWTEPPKITPETKAVEFPPMDISRADRLYLRTAAPFVSLTADPETRQAEIAFQPPPAEAPTSWSLL